MNNDLILGLFNGLLLTGIIIYQLIKTRNTRIYGMPGTRLILSGFGLLLMGVCLDMTDEFPQLSRFVVIGDTPVEAVLEKVFGYTLGIGLLLLGLTRILPVFAELEIKQQLIETIVETIPAPTFCKDDKGRYLLCNRAFETFLGLPRQQILGKTVFDLTPPDLAEIYHRADQELLEKMGKQAYETQVASADGTRKEVLFHKAVFPKKDGSAGGLVGVMLDISERKHIEEGLRDLDRMKSEFISIAAHELRTPLTSVQGYTELLLDPDTSRNFTDEQRRDFLHEICQAGETLNKLVDDLLDVGRIERGLPLPLDLRLQQPEALLRQVIEQFRLKDQSLQVELISELSPQFLLLFDEHRLRQMVVNLLSNAIKYSPAKGKIEINVRVQAKSFQLEVLDQGIGMSPAQTLNMFNKFYRAEKSQNWISGLGIGMSIVKSIVEAHHGQIEVESELGRGTSVRVSLPLAPA